jgi:hypothetical protein
MAQVNVQIVNKISANVIIEKEIKSQASLTGANISLDTQELKAISIKTLASQLVYSVPTLQDKTVLFALYEEGPISKANITLVNSDVSINVSPEIIENNKDLTFFYTS